MFISYLSTIWSGTSQSSSSSTLIANFGYDGAEANEEIENDRADAVAFGRPFISNPDLVERVANNWPLAEPDRKTFYGGDERGYSDYPCLCKLACLPDQYDRQTGRQTSRKARRGNYNQG